MHEIFLSGAFENPMRYAMPLLSWSNVWCVIFPSLSNPQHPVYANSSGAENEVYPRDHKDGSVDTSELL